MPPRELVSVVVPCLNEEENVRPLYRRLVDTLERSGVEVEIIFSCDPCTDRTEDVVRELRAADPRVKLLVLSRRFGQPAATLAGLRMSSGDACVVIDADLQDPPELIAEMIDRWREGFDVVYAQRRTRAGETVVKRLVAWLGYRVIRRVAEVDIPPNTGDFRLMSRRVVDEVLRLNESHGFLRGLVALVGFPQTGVLYDRDQRAGAEGKYNRLFGSLRIGLNGIVGFSRHPLHLISVMGMVLSLFAALFAFAYLLAKLTGVDFPAGNPTVVILLAFFSGIQLFCLGVMGEYVGRIYDEVKRRPMFIVDTMEGFERGGASRGDGIVAPASHVRRHRAVPSGEALPAICILAGGRGTRLGALTDATPKPLLTVAGRPFVEHQLELLRSHGARRIVLSVGYLAEQFERTLGDGSRFGLELAYVDDPPDAAGTADAVRTALPLLGEEFLVLYGDTYLRVDYRGVARAFAQSSLPALMTVLRNRGRWGESNAVYARGRVVAYGKKPPPAGAEWIDYGLLAFRPAAILGSDASDLARLLGDLAVAGLLAGYEARNRFYEIGTPDRLAETEAFLAGTGVGSRSGAAYRR